MTSVAVQVGGGASEELATVLENILDWIRAQHGNTLPNEVVHLLPPESCTVAVSGPSDGVALSDLTSSEIKDEETEDPYCDSLIDSNPTSPYPLPPYTSSVAVPAIDIVDITRILSTKHELAAHKCPHCRQEFESLHSLSQHAITHCLIRLTRVQASSGEEVPGSRREGRINRKQIKEEEAQARDKPPLKLKVKCRNCDESFASFRCTRYVQHLRLNPRHRDFRCSKCPAVYKLSSHLRIHIKDKHEGGLGKAHLCPQCGKTFKFPHAVTRHVRAVHERSDVFKCKYCQKDFYSHQHLEQHENIHLKRNRQQCPHCGLLKAPNNLKTHIETVHEGKRLKCNFCGDLIKGTIRGHLILKHAEVSDTVSSRETVTPIYVDLAMVKRRQRKVRPQEDQTQPVTEDLTVAGDKTHDHLTVAAEVEIEMTTDPNEDADAQGQFTFFVQGSEVNEGQCESFPEAIEADWNNASVTGLPEMLSDSIEVAHVMQDNSGLEDPSTDSIELLLPKRECHICKKYFVHLEAHIAGVHSEAAYKCNFCDRNCTTSTQLEQHVRWVHMLRNVEWARRRKAIKRPAVRKRNPKPKPSTRIPKKRVVQKIKQPVPAKVKRQRAPYQFAKKYCDICKTLVWDEKTKNSYEIHLIRHQRDPEYRYKERNLVKRIGEEDPVTVTVPKPKPVVITCKVVTSKARVVRVSKPKPKPPAIARVARIKIPKPKPLELGELAWAKCPYADCVQNLESCEALALHIKESHPDFNVLRRGEKLTGSEEQSPVAVRPKAPCPDCGKVLVWTSLKRHIQDVHRGKRGFHCEVCNKSFAQKSSLRLHETTKIHKELQIQKTTQDSESQN